MLTAQLAHVVCIYFCVFLFCFGSSSRVTEEPTANILTAQLLTATHAVIYTDEMLWFLAFLLFPKLRSGLFSYLG